jgi:GNAT superfamily N-acetyltransferase
MKFRKAIREELPLIVEMISNDPLGKLREDFQNPLPEKYYAAFDKINQYENQELIVFENDLGEVVGTLHLTFLQYLTYQGGIRAQIEAVRVREDQTGKGIGQQAIQWAINRAKEKGAHLIQLTSDKKRKDAIRFYEKLGFVASHEGMKLHL